MCFFQKRQMDENVTSSTNTTPITHLWLHPPPASEVWLTCLVCLALLGVIVNLVTCVVLVIGRSLQTTLYSYLTSLGVADVIMSSVVIPICAAKTLLIGQSHCNSLYLLFI